jgi:hypothetical protein
MLNLPWPFGNRLHGGKAPAPLDTAGTGFGQLIGGVYTNDPHVASEAVRPADVVRSDVALSRPVDRRRLEACVTRWRALATWYEGYAREAIMACADDLEQELRR